MYTAVYVGERILQVAYANAVWRKRSGLVVIGPLYRCAVMPSACVVASYGVPGHVPLNFFSFFYVTSQLRVVAHPLEN